MPYVYTECHVLFIVMLNVIILSVVMLNVMAPCQAIERMLYFSFDARHGCNL
jgi:hypothetical protein